MLRRSARLTKFATAHVKQNLQTVESIYGGGKAKVRDEETEAIFRGIQPIDDS